MEVCAGIWTGIEGYYSNFLRAIEQYKTVCMGLFIAWIVVFVCAMVVKIAKERIIISCLFLMMSLMLNFIHVFSSTYPERSMLSCTVCLLLAISVLLPELMECERYKALIYSGGMVVMLFALIEFFPGVYDVACVYRDFRTREAIIEEEKSGGNYDIIVNNLSPTTKYSAAYGLECNPTIDDASYWVNAYMAKFYEVDSILGPQ